MADVKLYIVNNVKSDTGVIFRNKLLEKLPDTITPSYIFSKDIGIDTGVTSGGVRILVAGEALDITASFFLFQGRGLDKNFIMTSLLSHVLHEKDIPFNDAVNLYCSGVGTKAFLVPRLAAHGLPVPRTLVVSYASFPLHLTYIEKEFSYPLILKVNGAQGVAVRKVLQHADLVTTLQQLQCECDKDFKSLITIQQYVENTYDVRALFYKDTYIASQKRFAQNGSFLNNVSQGGIPTPDILSDEEIMLCRHVVSLSLIDLAGVDFIRTSRGIVFLEVNQVPQLEGISSVYPDLDFAGPILADILNKLL